MTLFSRSQSHGFRARVCRAYLRLSLVAVVIASIALVFTRVPMWSTAKEDPVATGPYGLPGVAESSVWCLLSERVRVARALENRFRRLDPSAWWANILAQEHGPFHLQGVAELDWPLPENVRVLVIPSAVGSAGAEYTPRLGEFVDEGGTLFLEKPGGALKTLAGILDEDSQRIRVSRLQELGNDAGVDGIYYREPGVLEPLDLELAPVHLDSQTRLKMVGLCDGGGEGGVGERRALPALWTRSIGQGRVVATAFDLAETLLHSIQGRTRDDFTFSPQPREGALKDLPMSVDLAAGNPPYTVPILDLLVRRVWNTVLESSLLPDWYDVPEGAAAAYIATHDEEGFGDRSEYMAVAEAERGVRSTFFILPVPITRLGVSKLRSRGAEVALHWHRGFNGGNQLERKIGPFIVQRIEPNLADQVGMVSTLLESPAPAMTRIHGLQWDTDFDTSFRKLVAAGFMLDSSYGPAAGLEPYLFGSVRAWRPLDREGRILPILELPFVLQDDESEPLERLRRVMRDALALALPVVPIFHVNTMAYKPSVGPVEAWIEGFERARATNMWMGTVGEYLSFLQQREKSEITFVSSRTYASDTVENRIDVRADREGAWLRFPARVAAGELLTLEVEGAVTRRRCEERVDGHWAFVSIPRGARRVRAVYGRRPLKEGLCTGRHLENGNKKPSGL